MPVVVSSIAGLRDLIRAARADAVSRGIPNPTVALVPTMGALHDGHLALVDQASVTADIVVVSIFVNPLQFGDPSDLARYPRMVDADVEVLEGRAVQFVFAPAEAEMYPAGAVQTRVTAGEIGFRFEGRTRRGHFDGVLTVVSKLLHIIGPDFVLFGQKDAQQVFLVRQMIADLDWPVTVITVETVRDADGLALSSRNRFLDPRERRAARGLSVALEAAESAADGGVDAVLASAQSVLTGESAVQLDYLAIVNPKTFLPVDEDFRGKALVLVAARVGDTRLIDNAMVYIG